MKKTIGSPHLLPAVAICAALCFGVRFGAMLEKIEVAGSLTAYAYAADVQGIEPAAGEGTAPAQDALAAPDPAATGKKPEQAAAPEAPAKPDVQAPSLGSAPAAKSDWKSSDDLDDKYDDIKTEMFEDLAKRRKDLDAKEKELAMREALLKAAQAELEQKTNELTGIREDIQELLKKQTEEEDKRIASLVKIYEGMKAKDAARIFDTLEMDVLLQVVMKMSERKSAPIIAAMNPDRARNLTIMLAEQNKLPSIPVLPVEQ